MRRRHVTTAALVLAVGLAGCSSGGSGSGRPAGTTAGGAGTGGGATTTLAPPPPGGGGSTPPAPPPPGGGANPPPPPPPPPVAGIPPINPVGTIEIIAGDGTFDFAGDGGPADQARLSAPEDICVDPQGNLYFIDFGNDRIRKIDGATGDITTIAGNGTRGFSGDGGPATAAQLWSPRGLAIDDAGNLFIADNINYRIRMVDPAGIITTIAGNGNFTYSGDGGPALQASFRAPTDVAVFGGDVYVADFGGHHVRKIDRATGIIDSVVGGGPVNQFGAVVGGFSGDGGPATACDLDHPWDIEFDAAGNLFILDWANRRIRRVDAVTGIIDTVLGDGTDGYSGDGGPGTSAQIGIGMDLETDAAGNLFLADEQNQRVRRWDASTGIVTLFAGNGSIGMGGNGGPAPDAQLNYPGGVAILGSDVWISDRNNAVIRKIAP